MKRVVLLRFGELYLKGDNRKEFEKILVSNIKTRLSALGVKFNLSVTFGRYVVSDFDLSVQDEIVCALKQVFGLHSLSVATEVDSNAEQIEDFVSQIDLGDKTFRVTVNRADKSFPIGSMDYAKALGSLLCDKNPNATVDLHNPQVCIFVDIRQNGKSYIYTDSELCAGGLPLSSSGRALVLLSGGIDSPVAAYLMAKRGLKLHALHFYSYPYTSELAKQKVYDLAKTLTPYCGKIVLHTVSFTRVQEQIHANCVDEYMITIMRRIMMRVARAICQKENLGAIVTGESLGQVASQTMASMTVTGGAIAESAIPIFRPCIAMDKDEIVAVAKKIGTYEISILPYEDCCTVFLPKHPVIKPTIKKAEREEGFLDIDKLVSDALSSEEVLVFDL